jgi:hypothetical protein
MDRPEEHVRADPTGYHDAHRGDDTLTHPTSHDSINARRRPGIPIRCSSVSRLALLPNSGLKLTKTSLRSAFAA